MTACPTCHAPALGGLRFCRSCGTALTVDAGRERPSRVVAAPAEPACARCAMPYVERQRFCRGCGAPLAEGAPVDWSGPVGSSAAPQPVDDQLTRAAMATTATDDDEVTEERPQIQAKSEPGPTPLGETAFSSPALVPLPLDVTGESAAFAAPVFPPAEPQPSSAPGRPDRPTAAHASLPASGACEICGAPAAGRFCEDCEAPTLVTEPASSTAVDARAPRPPAPQVPAVTPSETRRRRGRWVALVVLVLLLAAGGTGAFFLLRNDDRRVGTPAAGVERTVVTTTSRPFRGNREDDASGQAAVPSTGGTSSSEDAPSKTPARNSTTADETTTATEQRARTPEAPIPATQPGPVLAMREHWQAIASGDLKTAYSRFSSQYTGRTAYGEWAGAQEDFDPDISIASVRLADRLSADKAVVRLTVVTRDRGAKGNTARCNVFRGRVLVRRQGGRWLYDPGGLPKGSFGPKKQGGVRPSSDKRCERLF